MLTIAPLCLAMMAFVAQPAAPRPAPVPAHTTTTPASGTSAPASPATTQPGKPVDVPADIKDGMKDLDARARPNSTPAATPISENKTASVSAAAPLPAPPSAPAASGGRLLREGTFIASRRGRVTRSTASTSTGPEWQVTFDSGTEGKAEAPMTLMPCQNLMAIEKIAERGGDSVTFTISGQVFLYKGRNYLLPTLYVINRRGDITPAQ